MKKIKAPLLSIALIVLNISVVIADETHPPPPQTARSTTSVPVGEGTPIDENIVALLLSGIALGGWFHYKNKIKKASV
ncbi:hypothetical protein [Flavobacterium foetidum]|uniref:hypothetical protein n=1 Tax=Flavobacterium foetidum TaxID=2026681 RepID=UPI0010751FA4|nr:hypothetical protein [Flavobacterium foetidum]KAF2514676.1 hypothetical protein E0W73_12045 [Flavobacterium foetidum]